MQVQEILTASIVFIPVAYALYIAVRFASGLAKLGKRPVSSITAPIAANQPEPEEDPWMASVSAGVIPLDAPLPIAVLLAKPSQREIALLPAFIPAVQIETTADEHALVESAWMRLYCNAGLDDVVVPFTRPLRAVQKPQQAHPAIEGMSLRKMRELGARLKIRGARRWNTAEAIEALTAYYQARAAA